MTLRNATRFSNIETDISATAPRFVGIVTVNSNLNNVSLNRQSQERTVTNEVFYNQTDLRINFNTGSLKHEVLLGAEFGVEKEHIVRYTRSRPMITPTTPDTIFAPNPYLAESQVGLRVASTADNGNVDTELNSLALLAQDFLSITDQWKVLGGLRWDDVDSEYTSTTGTAPHFERNDQAWSVRAGLVFQPTATQMYYGYYGTSFNPSAEFLTLSAATQQLDPEENETFELGARWDVLSSRLTLQGAIFRTDKTNARTVDPTNATVMVLDGKQRVDGVELGAVGRITPAWQVFAGLVYQDGQIVEGFEAVGGVPVSRAGNTLQSTPPWSGSLWTTYTWPSGWQFGRRPVLHQRRVRQQREHHQGRGLHAVRRDGGLCPAEVERPVERLQRDGRAVHRQLLLRARGSGSGPLGGADLHLPVLMLVHVERLLSPEEIRRCRADCSLARSGGMGAPAPVPAVGPRR